MLWMLGSLGPPHKVHLSEDPMKEAHDTQLQKFSQHTTFTRQTGGVNDNYCPILTLSTLECVFGFYKLGVIPLADDHKQNYYLSTIDECNDGDEGRDDDLD
ncbi:hypothetical protein VNO77_20295 [Canavalia gladiata]|uniref:Uncharacterized protein n=1 Tax=Canavalia gladiata TaxID=3824 RepID=A0AAN9QLB1_CANGL